MKIYVKVKPKARAEKVEKTDATHFLVHTKEVAEKGKANDGVIRLLSNYFSVPQSHLEIISGHTSRLKVIYIHI